MSRTRPMTVWVAATSVLAFDQLSKMLVQRAMFPNQSLPVIQGVFHITYVRNPGAAFGMLAYQTSFFVIVTALVVLLILFYGRQLAQDKAILRVALGMQLGGALGNLLDRLRMAHVVDFLDFRVWPVFNVADMAIVLGVLAFAYDILRRVAFPPGERG